MEYRVTWIIDIDAESFEDAAKKALDIHRDNESLAKFFTITNEQGEIRDLDLLPMQL